MLVKLQIFKRNGKWYTEGEYETNKEHLFEIWSEIRSKAAMGLLPGMIDNLGRNYLQDYIISVDVPDHPHRHPHLIM